MKLGIVTLSFNQARWLQEAIDSVALSQASDLVYVIVDPGSTDESRGIIECNRRRFAQVILEPDSGPAEGLNKGFAACDADIYGYLNADDRFVPGALDYVRHFFETNDNVDLLLGAIRLIDENGKPKVRGRAPDAMDPRRFAYGACFCWQQATFFRRTIFERAGGFNVENRGTWDGELALDMVLAGAKIGYTDTVLGDFRIHGSSITGSRKLVEVQYREIERFREKIKAAHYVPMRPVEAALTRLKYKFDPVRCLRGLFGIALPKQTAPRPPAAPG